MKFIKLDVERKGILYCTNNKRIVLTPSKCYQYNLRSGLCPFFLSFSISKVNRHLDRAQLLFHWLNEFLSAPHCDSVLKKHMAHLTLNYGFIWLFNCVFFHLWLCRFFKKSYVCIYIYIYNIYIYRYMII